MANEKREKKRSDVFIPVKIMGTDKAFATETMDISSSGIYCRTATALPLLSKVAISLVVPLSQNGKKGAKTIECRGTIVRTHPVMVDGKEVGHDVAIFFDEIKEGDKFLLTEYINQARDDIEK